MTDAAGLPDPRPAFAHASEAELARILDFYDVRWRYEPDTFPIGWSLDGEVVESFSPDFYLPDLDLYLELTTLKQSLVRKKNRKLRRLRELYPDVRIKLFYARDFRMLLLKFGRLALAAELSGTVGQATPPRARVQGLGDEGAELRRDVEAARARADLAADAADAAEAANANVGADAASQGLLAPADLLAADGEVGRTPRGRRRGRRRRAAARASALAETTVPNGLDVTVRPPKGVSSPGTLPA